MRTIKFAVVAVLILAIGVCEAQADVAALSTKLLDGKLNLTFRGQYRARFDFDSGKDFHEGNLRENVSQRARFGVKLSYKDRLSFFFQIQDVRIWGEETTTRSFSARGFDLHQGWAQIRVYDQLWFRIGRQELDLNDQRLVGAIDWSQEGQSFDAVRMTWNRDPWDLTVFYAKLGEEHSKNSSTKLDRDLGIVYLTYSGWTYLMPTAMWIIDTDYARKKVRHTAGTYLKGSWRTLEWRGEAYFQFGEDAEKGIKAFMFAAKLGYTLSKKTGNLGFDIWYEYLSGDRKPSDGTIRSFSTLFATNHNKYGIMDYFLDIPTATVGRGLVDVGVRIRAAPLAGLSVWLDYHFFSLPRRLASGKVYLGHEIDVSVTYRVFKYFRLTGGYGLFIAMSAMKELATIRNGTPAGNAKGHRAYVTADLKF